MYHTGFSCLMNQHQQNRKKKPIHCSLQMLSFFTHFSFIMPFHQIEFYYTSSLILDVCYTSLLNWIFDWNENKMKIDLNNIAEEFTVKFSLFFWLKEKKILFRANKLFLILICFIFFFFKYFYIVPFS